MRLKVDLPLALTRTNTGLELPLAVPGLRVQLAASPASLPALGKASCGSSDSEAKERPASIRVSVRNLREVCLST